mmetsp:Transcript_256/g.460  ORF Transcript_256/g.460 Transcript_256/m.460 type:complete len:130 (+) Transcript_256:873-1262(+)
MMPQGYFDKLAIQMKRQHSDIRSNSTHIVGQRPCSYYDFHNLTLSLAEGLVFHIPPVYYVRQAGDDSCIFLFQVNDEGSKEFDDIETAADLRTPQSSSQAKGEVEDFETNKGFILGLPFLRAFIFTLDT